MTTRELVALLDEAAAVATAANGGIDVAALCLRILTAASDSPEVSDALRDVPAGRALLRFTDSDAAIEFAAGEGAVAAHPADKRGKGPKVDAGSTTWLGLFGGTLRPWLAFTRGAVVCRAGLTELRWMQTVAERLQRAYAEARRE
ncbi:MAG: hypothetical protein ABR525_07525 [Candidatus Limnocylindria bacterium]